MTVLLFLERKLHRKRGSLAGGALHLDAPSDRFYNLPRNPQAQSEASILARGDSGLETLEDDSLLLRRDADTVVSDSQDGMTVLAADPDLDGPALAVLDGVRDEVRHHLVQAWSIPEPDHVRLGLERDRRVRSESW